MSDMEHGKDKTAGKLVGKGVNAGKWYSIPEPVRRIFDQFPLITYKENILPQRAKRRTEKHTLYVFGNIFDAEKIGLSCNPTCLKWQAYLKFNDIDFLVVPSNNHASPSGSLPFLLPASSTKDTIVMPLTTSKIPRWTSQQVMQEEDFLSIEQEMYMALIDQNVRNAWLYHLYLDEANFNAVAKPLYVSTASSNTLVQMAITYQLKHAAQSELLKRGQIIDRTDVYTAAANAFKALSILLGNRIFFSGDQRPGLFDASLFAYTHLILDRNIPWENKYLYDILRGHPNLLDHSRRLLDIYSRS